jgi:hypothetical protein
MGDPSRGTLTVWRVAWREARFTITHRTSERAPQTPCAFSNRIMAASQTTR